jgi:hypothetical protein
MAHPQGEAMYADAESTLIEILKLVAKCPEKLQERCFELLMEAYLDSKVPAVANAAGTQGTPAAHPGANLQAPVAPTPPPTVNGGNAVIPDALRSRFHATAGRLGVKVEKLGGLFDFQLDPYNYHALVAPGANKAERCRNVALLLCAKSYLTLGGDWSADWKEFRTVCYDQQCWDPANAAIYLSKTGNFKTASAGEGIVLASKGVNAAQELLTSLLQGEQG